jgi:nucleoside 2-deoxyribosyltransferase
MQPFDGDVFDKRFDDVLAPAIAAANLEPYRVDRDVEATVLINDIEAGIRSAEVCLAEISSDNPNVWYELGYAFACGKEVVLVCSAARTKFPFDIQHRSVITYKPESPRDFEHLAERITARLKVASRKASNIATLAASPLSDTEGLAAHEIAALATVMEGSLELDSPPSSFSIKQDMLRAGFTDVAAAIAIKRLMRIGYVEITEAQGRNESYTGFILTGRGEDWLLKNQSRLVLRQKGAVQLYEDDDLPF